MAVHVEALNLVEEAVGAGADGLVAVHAAGAYHADGWLRRFHHAALHRAGVRAQHDVGVLLDEEGVLHVAGRMVGCEVHRAEHVPVVLNLRTVGQREAQAGEDVDDFLLDDGQRVARAQADGVGRTRQVQFVARLVVGGELFAQGVDLFLGGGLQLVQLHADFALGFGRHGAEVRHEVVYQTFLAQVFDA